MPHKSYTCIYNRFLIIIKCLTYVHFSSHYISITSTKVMYSVIVKPCSRLNRLRMSLNVSSELSIISRLPDFRFGP
ncbi:hypothetical protein C2G38_474002 [Gigaspora rosea]|uniref:Uncharacterized protein n=1 Tax=Gigaspora rosea TaxID=44941 RepID=A0A397VZJ2_9GLOM|nr:hypothetical protein C2G38_474002 [Gigaspora rosea]